MRRVAVCGRCQVRLSTGEFAKLDISSRTENLRATSETERRYARVKGLEEGKGTFGFNAASGEYGDMLEMGILDPTKVTRLALQNATSVSSVDAIGSRAFFIYVAP